MAEDPNSTIWVRKPDGSYRLRRVNRDKGAICQVAFCQNLKCINHVLRKGGRVARHQKKICSACSKREWRFNNWEREIESQIRWSAKKRGLICCINLAILRALPRWEEYKRRRGQEPLALHIDRKNHLLGYVPGNLQVMIASENIKKRNHDLIRHRNHRLDPELSNPTQEPAEDY